MDSMFNYDDVRARANKGAELLHEASPGWWKKENLDITGLEMSDCYQCVLGWVFGDFMNGIDAFNSTGYGWAYEHGFDGGDEVPDDYENEYYEVLTEVWLDIINDLRWRGTISEVGN